MEQWNRRLGETAAEWLRRLREEEPPQDRRLRLVLLTRCAVAEQALRQEKTDRPEAVRP